MGSWYSQMTPYQTKTKKFLKQVDTTLLIIYFLIQRRGKLNFQKVKKLQNLKLFVLSSWNLRGNDTLEIVSEAVNQKLRPSVPLASSNVKICITFMRTSFTARIQGSLSALYIFKSQQCVTF